MQFLEKLWKMSENIEILACHNRKKKKLFGCNWTRTQNHLVRKQTLNYSAKLA